MRESIAQQANDFLSQAYRRKPKIQGVQFLLGHKFINSPGNVIMK